MQNRLQLCKTGTGDAMDATRYRSVVGSLRYLCNTRPDITYAVGIVSRYLEAPAELHWAAVKQILRYVSGTLEYGCCYKRGGISAPEVIGYSDSDHAGNVDDRRSTTGVVFFLDSSVITWISQKQKVVAISSCEAEYMAAASATCQGVWLCRFLGELTGDAPTMAKPSTTNGKVDVDHVGTDGQLADVLTKALGRIKFIELRQKLGVVKVIPEHKD
ncbi:secreted RxLR effector protein 161-like [Aegilops tauschii subsp. strangulata]|uniref:secreted RxLR effector protein 161-like n=1 Tax=Aegilops tauschii subsp. strangulata TaxID=200361 RepID=UPI001ABD279F|nr:secreted RxLR effector protein 161-like [Aegilops tauschii subsp. strangulata]